MKTGAPVLPFFCFRNARQSGDVWANVGCLGALHGRFLRRPRPSAGRTPPKIPKCSSKRLACSFGVRSSKLSQSRLKSLGRSLALPSVGRAGRSRWSPSNGRTFFRYFGGDGGSTYCGGDGGSTAFSFAVERLGSTTGDFLLRARSSSSMMLGARNAARLAARQKKKYRSGWCQLMVQLPRDSRGQRAVKDRQR